MDNIQLYKIIFLIIQLLRNKFISACDQKLKKNICNLFQTDENYGWSLI